MAWRSIFREYAIHGVVLGFLLLLVFPGVFLRGEIAMPAELLYKYPPWAAHAPEHAEVPANWLTQDVLSFFHANYGLVERSFQHGEWPLWNDLQFMGAPLLANYQSTVFYPPRLLHRLLEFHVATTVFMVLKFFLCGMNAYICGRGIGLTAGAARLLSVGWMLCLYNVTWCYWPLPDVAAWLPLMFLGVEFIVDGRHRRGFGLLAFSATAFMLAGHPETAFTIAAFLGIYFVLRLAVRRDRVAKPLLIAGGVWAAVLLVSAAQLLPFLEYLPNSFTLENRPKSDEGSLYALPIAGAVLFWVPRFFGMMADGNFWAGAPANSNYSAMFYAGIVPWLALVACRFAPNRVRLVCLAVPAVLSLLLVFDTPLAGAVKSLPLLNATRSGYFAGFGLFAVLILGAKGVDAWTARERSWRESYPFFAAAGVVAVITVGSYFGHMMPMFEAGAGTYTLAAVLAATLFSAIGALLFAIARGGRRHAFALTTGLFILLSADLLIAGRGIVPTSPRDTFLPETQLTTQATALDPPARVRVLPMFSPAVPPGFIAPYGIEQFHRVRCHRSCPVHAFCQSYGAGGMGQDVAGLRGGSDLGP